MASQADILALLTTLNTGVDTLIAAAAPQDLQPVADAVNAIQAKVTAAIAPPPPPAS